jgi:hypothetical protein
VAQAPQSPRRLPFAFLPFQDRVRRRVPQPPVLARADARFGLFAYRALWNAKFSYAIVRSGNGGFTVTVCNDKAGADESVEKARARLHK